MHLRYLIFPTLLLASCTTVKDRTESIKENTTNVAIEAMVQDRINNTQATENVEKREEQDYFAFSLFERICGSDTSENICISPASAESALAMVANGAQGNTLEQILSTLDSDMLDSLNNKKLYQEPIEGSHTTITSANSIWINENLPVKEKFIADNKRYHNAEVANVPFNDNTLSKINEWCSQKTNGKITDILDKLDNSTKMLLINALYLKGGWRNEFNKNATEDAPFTKADGTTVNVKMMHQTVTTSYNLDDNLRMVAMPLKESNIDVLFVLPRRGMSMNDAIANLAASYDTLRRDMNPRQRVKLWLPRFKTEYKRSLKEQLMAMGMSDAFGSSANLKGISDAPLYIDDILQKTYLSIDEKGAEAAAVTSVTVGLLSARPTTEPIELKFDRPFIYIITDTQTGNILFIGKVGNPTE